jgi:hypothetical protein
MMFYSKCGPSAAKADVACAMRRLSGKCARVTHHSVAPILPMKSKGRFHPSNARRGSIGLSDALSAMDCPDVFNGLRQRSSRLIGISSALDATLGRRAAQWKSCVR